jgi:hypothetical protein
LWGARIGAQMDRLTWASWLLFRKIGLLCIEEKNSEKEEEQKKIRYRGANILGLSASPSGLPQESD